jgi:hypothetical protein
MLRLDVLLDFFSTVPAIGELGHEMQWMVGFDFFT